MKKIKVLTSLASIIFVTIILTFGIPSLETENEINVTSSNFCVPFSININPLHMISTVDKIIIYGRFLAQKFHIGVKYQSIWNLY